jgi:hypothetical protein
MVPYLSSFIHCLVCRSLEQLDQAFLDTVKQKVAACIEGANNQQMKEIRYRVPIPVTAYAVFKSSLVKKRIKNNRFSAARI